MATEAAHLFVTVSADVDKGVRGLNQVNDAAGKTDGFLKGAAKTALGFGTAMVGLNAGAAAFGLIKGGAIDMNAQLEKSTLQFETLMGDSDKAREHVEGLFDFAAKTPFETGPIIEASRIMETFGGAALNTKDNLTLFGDAAAATGGSINEVGFWMSRAYADIQAGRPFGEAAMRLAELGVVTPQTRSKLEDLQKTGASGEQVWDTLTGALGRFDGAMAKQADTFDGQMATLMDGINMFLAKGLRPLFDGLKGLIRWLNEVMSSPGFNGAMEAAGAALGKVFGVIGKAIDAIAGVVGPIVSAFAGLFDAIGSGGDIAEDVAYEVSRLGDTLGSVLVDGLNAALDALLGFLPKAAQFAMDTVGQMVDGFMTQLPALLDAVASLMQAVFDWLVNVAVPKAAEAIGPLALQFVDWVGQMVPKLIAALPMIAEAILNFLATNLPILIGKLAEWGAAFIGWVASNVLPRLPGALASIAGAIFGWLASTAGTLVAKAGEMGAGFVTGVITFIGELPGKMADILGQVVSTVLGWGTRMGGAFGDIAIKAGKAFANGIVGLIEGAVNAVIRGINSFQIHFDGIDLGPLGRVAAVHWSGFNLGYVNLPRFEQGAWDTGSRSFIGMIDPHEMIVPAGDAQRWRDGGGGEAPIYIEVNIGNYYGSEDHAHTLSRMIGESVRAQLPRRTVTVGAR